MELSVVDTSTSIGRFMEVTPNTPKYYLLGRHQHSGSARLTEWDVRGLRQWAAELGPITTAKKVRLMLRQSKGCYGIGPAAMKDVICGRSYAWVK